LGAGEKRFFSLGMPPTPVSRDLIRLIREISKKENASGSEGLRLIEERQSKEIEFFFQALLLLCFIKKIFYPHLAPPQACALRLDACI